jgi:hypothetical protein
MEDAFDIGYDIAWNIITGHIATSIATRIAGRSSWKAFAIALAINAGVQLSLAALVNKAWKDARTWFISFFASIISAAGGAFVRILEITMMKWLTGIARTICGQATHIFNSWFAMGLSFALIMEIAYIFLDAVLALIFYMNYVNGVVW